MGWLRSFHLDYLINRFGSRILVETGTGSGISLRYAREFPFDAIYSIEIIPEQMEKLRPQFADDPRIHLILGESTTVLRDLLPTLKSNTIFWLDAHMPGADLGMARYNQNWNVTVAFPLQR